MLSLRTGPIDPNVTGDNEIRIRDSDVKAMLHLAFRAESAVDTLKEYTADMLDTSSDEEEEKGETKEHSGSDSINGQKKPEVPPLKFSSESARLLHETKRELQSLSTPSSASTSPRRDLSPQSMSTPVTNPFYMGWNDRRLISPRKHKVNTSSPSSTMSEDGKALSSHSDSTASSGPGDAFRLGPLQSPSHEQQRGNSSHSVTTTQHRSTSRTDVPNLNVVESMSDLTGGFIDLKRKDRRKHKRVRTKVSLTEIGVNPLRSAPSVSDLVVTEEEEIEEEVEEEDEEVEEREREDEGDEKFLQLVNESTTFEELSGRALKVKVDEPPSGFDNLHTAEAAEVVEENETEPERDPTHMRVWISIPRLSLTLVEQCLVFDTTSPSPASSSSRNTPLATPDRSSREPTKVVSLTRPLLSVVVKDASIAGIYIDYPSSKEQSDLSRLDTSHGDAVEVDATSLLSRQLQSCVHVRLGSLQVRDLFTYALHRLPHFERSHSDDFHDFLSRRKTVRQRDLQLDPSISVRRKEFDAGGGRGGSESDDELSSPAVVEEGGKVRPVEPIPAKKTHKLTGREENKADSDTRGEVEKPLRIEVPSDSTQPNLPPGVEPLRDFASSVRPSVPPQRHAVIFRCRGITTDLMSVPSPTNPECMRQSLHIHTNHIRVVYSMELMRRTTLLLQLLQQPIQNFVDRHPNEAIGGGGGGSRSRSASAHEYNTAGGLGSSNSSDREEESPALDVCVHIRSAAIAIPDTVEYKAPTSGNESAGGWRENERQKRGEEAKQGPSHHSELDSDSDTLTSGSESSSEQTDESAAPSTLPLFDSIETNNDTDSTEGHRSIEGLSPIPRRGLSDTEEEDMMSITRSTSDKKRAGRSLSPRSSVPLSDASSRYTRRRRTPSPTDSAPSAPPRKTVVVVFRMRAVHVSTTISEVLNREVPSKKQAKNVKKNSHLNRKERSESGLGGSPASQSKVEYQINLSQLSSSVVVLGPSTPSSSHSSAAEDNGFGSQSPDPVWSPLASPASTASLGGLSSAHAARFKDWYWVWMCLRTDDLFSVIDRVDLSLKIRTQPSALEPKLEAQCSTLVLNARGDELFMFLTVLQRMGEPATGQGDVDETYPLLQWVDGVPYPFPLAPRPHDDVSLDGFDDDDSISLGTLPRGKEGENPEQKTFVLLASEFRIHVIGQPHQASLVPNLPPENRNIPLVGVLRLSDSHLSAYSCPHGSKIGIGIHHLELEQPKYGSDRSGGGHSVAALKESKLHGDPTRHDRNRNIGQPLVIMELEVAGDEDDDDEVKIENEEEEEKEREESIFSSTSSTTSPMSSRKEVSDETVFKTPRSFHRSDSHLTAETCHSSLDEVEDELDQSTEAAFLSPSALRSLRRQSELHQASWGDALLSPSFSESHVDGKTTGPTVGSVDAISSHKRPSSSCSSPSGSTSTAKTTVTLPLRQSSFRGSSRVRDVLSLSYSITTDVSESAIPVLRLDLDLKACEVIYLPSALTTIGDAMAMHGIVGLDSNVEAHLKSLSAAELRWLYMVLKMKALHKYRRLERGTRTYREVDPWASISSTLARTSRSACGGRRLGEDGSTGSRSVLQTKLNLTHLSYYLQAAVSHMNIHLSRIEVAFPVALLVDGQDIHRRSPGGDHHDHQLETYLQLSLPDIRCHTRRQKGFHFGSHTYDVSVNSLRVEMVRLAAAVRSGGAAGINAGGLGVWGTPSRGSSMLSLNRTPVRNQKRPSISPRGNASLSTSAILPGEYEDRLVSVYQLLSLQMLSLLIRTRMNPRLTRHQRKQHRASASLGGGTPARERRSGNLHPHSVPPTGSSASATGTRGGGGGFSSSSSQKGFGAKDLPEASYTSVEAKAMKIEIKIGVRQLHEVYEELVKPEPHARGGNTSSSKLKKTPRGGSTTAASIQTRQQSPTAVSNADDGTVDSPPRTLVASASQLIVQSLTISILHSYPVIAPQASAGRERGYSICHLRDRCLLVAKLEAENLVLVQSEFTPLFIREERRYRNKNHRRGTPHSMTQSWAGVLASDDSPQMGSPHTGSPSYASPSSSVNSSRLSGTTSQVDLRSSDMPGISSQYPFSSRAAVRDGIQRRSGRRAGGRFSGSRRTHHHHSSSFVRFGGAHPTKTVDVYVSCVNVFHVVAEDAVHLRKPSNLGGGRSDHHTSKTPLAERRQRERSGSQGSDQQLPVSDARHGAVRFTLHHIQVKHSERPCRPGLTTSAASLAVDLSSLSSSANLSSPQATVLDTDVQIARVEALMDLSHADSLIRDANIIFDVLKGGKKGWISPLGSSINPLSPSDALHVDTSEPLEAKTASDTLSEVEVGPSTPPQFATLSVVVNEAIADVCLVSKENGLCNLILELQRLRASADLSPTPLSLLVHPGSGVETAGEDARDASSSGSASSDEDSSLATEDNVSLQQPSLVFSCDHSLLYILDASRHLHPVVSSCSHTSVPVSDACLVKVLASQYRDVRPQIAPWLHRCCQLGVSHTPPFLDGSRVPLLSRSPFFRVSVRPQPPVTGTGAASPGATGNSVSVCVEGLDFFLSQTVLSLVDDLNSTFDSLPIMEFVDPTDISAAALRSRQSGREEKKEEEKEEEKSVSSISFELAHLHISVFDAPNENKEAGSDGEEIEENVSVGRDREGQETEEEKDQQNKSKRENIRIPSPFVMLSVDHILVSSGDAPDEVVDRSSTPLAVVQVEGVSLMMGMSGETPVATLTLPLLSCEALNDLSFSLSLSDAQLLLVGATDPSTSSPSCLVALSFDTCQIERNASLATGVLTVSGARTLLTSTEGHRPVCLEALSSDLIRLSFARSVTATGSPSFR